MTVIKLVLDGTSALASRLSGYRSAKSTEKPPETGAAGI
jgi:hypothetical protein